MNASIFYLSERYAVDLHYKNVLNESKYMIKPIKLNFNAN